MKRDWVTLFVSLLAFMGIVPLYMEKVTPIVLGLGVVCLALMIWAKKPAAAWIKKGYPIASYFYAVTASPIGEPAPEESYEDLAALIDWILSEQGQWLIEQTGYVGIG